MASSSSATENKRHSQRGFSPLQVVKKYLKNCKDSSKGDVKAPVLDKDLTGALEQSIKDLLAIDSNTGKFQTELTYEDSINLIRELRNVNEVREELFNKLAQYIFLATFYQLLNSPALFPRHGYVFESSNESARKDLADAIRTRIDAYVKTGAEIGETAIQDKYNNFVNVLHNNGSKRSLASLQKYLGDLSTMKRQGKYGIAEPRTIDLLLEAYEMGSDQHVPPAVNYYKESKVEAIMISDENIAKFIEDFRSSLNKYPTKTSSGLFKAVNSGSVNRCADSLKAASRIQCSTIQHTMNDRLNALLPTVSLFLTSLFDNKSVRSLRELKTFLNIQDRDLEKLVCYAKHMKGPHRIVEDQSITDEAMLVLKEIINRKCGYGKQDGYDDDHEELVVHGDDAEPVVHSDDNETQFSRSPIVIDLTLRIG